MSDPGLKQLSEEEFEELRKRRKLRLVASAPASEEAPVGPPAPAPAGERVGVDSPEDNPPTWWEAALRGMQQGGTLGYADEAASFLSHPIDADKRRQALEAIRARNAAAKEAYPTTYGAGDIGTMMAMSIAAPGSGAARGLPGLARGAAEGAITTAADRVGRSEGSVGERLQEVPGAAAEGAGWGLALGSIPRAAQRLGETAPIQRLAAAIRQRGQDAGDMATRLRARAAGQRVGDLRGIRKRYRGGLEGFGEDMRAEGIGQGAFPATVQTHLQQAEEVLARSAEKFDAVRESLRGSDATVDMAQVADQIRAKVLRELQGDPSLRNVARRIESFAQAYTKLGQVPFDQAHKLRQSLDEIGSTLGDVSGKRISAIRKVIDEHLGKTADAYGQGAAWREANRGYRVAKQILGGSETEMDRVASGRQFFQPMDAVGGMKGAAVAGVLGADPSGMGAGAMLGYMGNRALRGREHAIKASVKEAISRTLQTAPDKFGRFAQQLQSAADRGGAALAAQHLKLSGQSQEYREKWRQIQDEEHDEDEDDDDAR